MSQRIIETVPFGLFTIVAHGTVLYWNAAMEALSGRRRRDAVGRSYGETLPYLNAHATTIQRVFDTGLPIRVENVGYVGPTGVPSTATLHMAPLGLTSGPPQALGLMEDVTQRLRVDHQLIRSERLAAIGELAAGIAHNFNNILAAIGGDAQMLKLAAEEEHLPAHVGEAAQQIHEGAMRGGRVARDLLAFARGGEPQLQRLSIPEMVESTLRLTRHHPHARAVTCHADVAPRLPQVEADPNYLSQIFVNLTLNALQAMPHGGILTISAAVRSAEDDPIAGVLEVKFHDTGIGISRENLRRIFDPFYSQRADGTQGQGLGLSVSLAMIKSLGGDIQVTSAEGIGTTVSVTLPIIERRAAPRPLTAAAPPRGRALIVDEDSEVRRTLTALLLRQGFCLHSTASADEALALIGATTAPPPFRLALTEWLLPGADPRAGRRVVETLARSMPVIVLTSSTRPEQLDEARRAGAGAVFSKPPVYDALLAAVQRLCTNDGDVPHERSS